MQQIRCGVCGRQTLVDPQSPGTCPSCGFPLSVPVEVAAPVSVPAAAEAADASGAGAPVPASPAEPEAPAAPVVAAPVVAAPVVAAEESEAAVAAETFTIGPVVADPAPHPAHVAEREPAPAPASGAFVIGPVVGDPVPAEMAEAAETAFTQESAAPVVAETAPEPPASSADAGAQANEVATASDVEPPTEPAPAAFVPPVPVPHSAWQDVSDAAESNVAIPTPAADDIYAAREPEPAPAGDAETEEVEEAMGAAPGLAVQTPRFDASDAAIVTTPEPERSTAGEDIYVTRMAAPEPAPAPETALEPEALEPETVVAALPVWDAPTADTAVVEAPAAEAVAVEAEMAEGASREEPATEEPATEEAVREEAVREEAVAAGAEPATADAAAESERVAEAAPSIEPEHATMPAAEIPAEVPIEAQQAPALAAEQGAPSIADEAVTQVAAAPVEQEPTPAAPSAPPQPPQAPQAPQAPQPAAYPQYPQYSQYPQQPAAPYPGYASPSVPLPGQYPYGAPPQPGQPPTAPYPYGAPLPQAPTAPYPYPYPASPSMPIGPTGQMGPMGPMGQMPPMSPMSQVPPQPKKSRVGLIVALIIAGVLVLALIIAAIVGLLYVQPATSSGSGAVAPVTPTAAPVTPTSSIPTGFQPYTGTDGSFSLNVPSDWTQNTSSSSNSNVIDFTAPDNTGRLRVAVIPGTVGDQGSSFEDLLFGIVLSNGKVSNKQGPSSITQAGETWTQESADVSNDTASLHVVADVTTHAGNTYTVLYLAAPDSFSTLQSQDFQPMFTSLQFLK